MKTLFILFTVFMGFVCITGQLGQAKETQDPFSEKDKGCLLDLARYTLHYYLTHSDYPFMDKKQLPPSLQEKRACFVTLTKRQSGLRGCIGVFEPSQPVYLNVMERTIYAATRDPRFRSVTPDELKDIKIEISLLTLPKPLEAETPEALVQALRPGIDGVILSSAYGSSTYLPQVWEQLPDKIDFLSRLSRKQGAPANIWKLDFKNIRVQTYQAIHFEEDEFGRTVIERSGVLAGKKGAKVTGRFPCVDGIYPIDVLPGMPLPVGSIVSSDSSIIEK